MNKLLVVAGLGIGATAVAVGGFLLCRYLNPKYADFDEDFYYDDLEYENDNLDADDVLKEFIEE